MLPTTSVLEKEVNMTQREFFASIVEGTPITAEQATFAVEAIAKIDKRNEKRASTPSKTAIANEPIKADIVKALEGKGPTPAAAIGTALGITTQKASALARQLVEAGTLEVFEVKVKGKGKVKAYALKPEA